jgi:hypothetical protein
MSIIEKVLAAALAVFIAVALGALWYADHEHGKLAPMQSRLADVAVAASQAAADRDAALQAAKDAQKQASAAQAALESAQASEAAAAEAASAARGKLAKAYQSSPDVAKTLDTPLPKAVWDAIYKPTGD